MRYLNWFEPGQRLDAEKIRMAESRLGVKFPLDYVNIVKEHSGANNPDESEFKYTDQGIEKVGNFGTLLALSDSDTGSVFETINNFSGQIPMGVIPIVDTGSGDCVCLDYRKSITPKIVYYSHERSGEQSLASLASSFSEFLDQLREPIDD